MKNFKFAVLSLAMTIIVSGNAYAQACGGGHGPCPVNPDPVVTPEGVTPRDQQPSIPLPPVIETDPPQVSDVFPAPPSNQSNNNQDNIVETPPPPPAPENDVVIIFDEPLVSTETVIVNPAADKPKPVVIAIDNDGNAILTDDAGAAALSQQNQQQAQFQNETLAQFNMGQDLYGSNFDILEQAAFLITPEEGEPSTEPILIFGGLFTIPGKPGRTQEQMVEDLLERAHNGDEEAIGQIITGMMAAGLELINKPENQLTQAERQFVAFLEQRIQNMRLEVALNTQAQWEQYQEDYQENVVGDGMSQLLAGPPSPRDFDPQVVMNFDNPDPDIVAGISGIAGGAVTGSALATAGSSGAIAAAAGNAALVAAANSMNTVAATTSVVASSVAGPVVIGLATAASAAYQIFRTAEFEEYDQAVEDAVAEAGRPVDLQELANGGNGDQVVANAMAMIFLNNAGAIAPGGVAAPLPSYGNANN